LKSQKIDTKISRKKISNKIIQTMIDDGVPSLCVCSTRHIAPQMGLDRQKRQRQITKRFNGKQRHSSVRYMKNKQNEVSQDG